MPGIGSRRLEADDEREGCVYLVRNTVNRKGYVGCTQQKLSARWRQHVRCARAGSRDLVHCAIRKYGEAAFVVEVVEKVNGGRAKLLAVELKHIAAFNSIAPNGYNINLGGGGSDFSVPEVRARHAAGIARRSLDPRWREVLAQRSADPSWREKNARHCYNLHNDPVLQQAIAEGLRRKFSDPEYQRIQAERTRKTTRSKKWKDAHAAGIIKRSADPDWQEMQRVKLKNMWAATAAKTAARDALLTPEERARRMRRRASWKRWKQSRTEGKR